jgi:putative iron-dependent peroxidase
MAEPDPGVVPQPVLSPLTTAAIFLVVTIDPGGESVARELLSGLAGLQRSVGFRVPDGRLSGVAGVGSQAWDRLFSGPRPAELHPFRELIGAEHRGVHARRPALPHPGHAVVPKCLRPDRRRLGLHRDRDPQVLADVALARLRTKLPELQGPDRLAP